MSDALAKRMSDSTRADALERLARDAERLAQKTRQYADALKSRAPTTGDAFQIAQSATDLLRQEARLEGMNQLAPLIR